MAGLMDILSDPNAAGLLGMGQGLLAASGAQRLPVTMGAAMASGLGGMQQSAAGAQEMQQRDIQNQTARYGLERQRWMMDLLQNMLQGAPGSSPMGAGAAQQPNQPLPVGSPMAPGMVPPLAQAGNYNMGGVGPTVGNAARLDAGAPTGMPLPAGMTPQQVAMGSLFPSMLPGFLPTNAQKEARDPLLGQGTQLKVGREGMTDIEKLQSARAIAVQQFGPASPQVQQIDTSLAKANYTPSEEIRQGNLARNPLTNQVVGYNPTVDKNIVPSFSKDATGAWMPSSVSMLPGTTGAVSQLAAAEQGAKQGATVGEVTNPNGSTTRGWNANLLGPAPGPAPNVPPILAAPRKGAQAAAPQGVTGPSTTDTALRASGMKMYTAAQSEAQGLGVYRDLLNTAQQLFADPNNHFGPGSPELARLKSMASNLPGIDLSKAQTAQDIMSKVANQIGTSQLGVQGTGSDAQLQSLLHSNPHGEMTNAAGLKVIPMIMSQLDVKEARAKSLQSALNASGDAKDVPKRFSDFNGMADPQTVSLGRQLAAASSAGQVQQFIAGLTPTQRALLPKVQKLDAIGAF
jgi:hypothetical protein